MRNSIVTLSRTRFLASTLACALALITAPAAEAKTAFAANAKKPGVTKKSPSAASSVNASKARKPANARGAYRVVSLECRSEDNTQSGFGLAHLTADPSDANVGTFGATIYLRSSTNQVLQKALQGSYTVVPGGYVLRSQWPSPEYHFFNLHRADRTSFPGVPGRHACVATGHLDQE